MPYLFRKIRQSRWLEREFDWLAQDEIPSDPLADFTTKSGALSIYVIEHLEHELIQRVAAAIAATSSNLSNLDFAIIRVENIHSLEFKISHEPATTPDEFVNRLHYDIRNLSAQALVGLVKLFWLNQDLNIDRIPEKDILQQIVFGVSQGYIQRSKIKIQSDRLWQHFTE